MKLFALIALAFALTLMLTGCSFAITPLMFLLENKEVEQLVSEDAPKYCAVETADCGSGF